MTMSIKPVIEGLDRLRAQYSKEVWANEESRKGVVMGLRMAADYLRSGVWLELPKDMEETKEESTVDDN